MPRLATPSRPARRASRLQHDLSDIERAELLDLARWALACAVQGAPDLALAAARTVGEAIGGQERTGAAFVTLREGGELRGCIGLLDASSPLRRSVALAAVGAALHDWRFRPVSEIELPAIEIEVSVLGPMAVLDDPLDFVLGEEGLLVSRGASRGLLLPDVATAHRFDRVAMLEATCRKAGLAPDAWCLPGTRVEAFRTVRFDGPALPAAATVNATAG
jgi:AmmeMemoRadiSam system protein A